MGSNGGLWLVGDVITQNRANWKGVVSQDTTPSSAFAGQIWSNTSYSPSALVVYGSDGNWYYRSIYVAAGNQIASQSNTYAGMIAIATTNSSGNYVDHRYQRNSQNTDWIDTSITGTGVYGDGSDGSAIYTSSTSLARDVYFTNLTVTSGSTITIAGFRIFCSSSLTLGGIISAKGADASGATAGAAPTANYLGGGAAGGNGGSNGATGANGGSYSNSLGGSGGQGGADDSYGGGLAGVVTTPAVTDGSFRHIPAAIQLRTFPDNASPRRINGGGGGGGGGSESGFGDGGGGGSGGGVMVIASPIINITSGTITAAGGKGADGTGANKCGGGGGGGGGCIVLVYKTLVNFGTITVAGGAKGLHKGTFSADGVAGTSGSVIYIQH